MKATQHRNPLVDESPLDTLENARSVLALLQHLAMGSWDHEIDEQAQTGQLIVLRALDGALESLEPHVTTAQAAARGDRHG